MESNLEFTGEFFVPGKSGERIEADHMARYQFASKYVFGKSVLDIACGAGYSAPLFIKAGAKKYLGVDLNDQVIEHASSAYASDVIKYQKGNICTFKSSELFDFITCFETIEHVPDYLGAISNLKSLLKPGGKLFISSPNRPITSPKIKSLSDKPANKYHTQEFIPEELIELLEKHHFKIDENSVYGQRQIYSNVLL